MFILNEVEFHIKLYNFSVATDSDKLQVYDALNLN